MSPKNITFLRMTHLRGPNIWTYRPVIEAWVDIGDLEDHPSNTIPGFYERLTAQLPSLASHRCGIGEPGGFLERLRDGTWPGHIMEHVALELQTLAGMKTGFGKARQTHVRGVYKVVIRTRHEAVGRASMEAARDLTLAAIENRPYDVAAAVARLTQMVDTLCLGPSTACMVDAATERGIPSIRLSDGNLVQLGQGAHQRRIWTAETDRTSAIAEGIARDKDLTKQLLACCGVPVPKGRAVDSAEQAWEAAQDIGLPVAVKPSDGNHGRGVALDLHTREEILAAFPLAAAEGSEVLVEQHIQGEEHRLLVVGNQVVAATRGEIATVSGDGRSTVAELIELQLNSDPRRGEEEDYPLDIIRLGGNSTTNLELKRQGLTADSVPTPGRIVVVARNGNMTHDVTDELHPDVAEQAALAARIVGLDIAGIDLVARDISRPLAEQGGAIVEVNAGPGLLMHLKPAVGEPRPVGQAIVRHLFPNAGTTGRIPLVGVIGGGASTRAARLVAWLLHLSGLRTGLSCADGLYLNQRRVETREAMGWDAGQRLLVDRSVEAAVVQSSARHILAEGLPYDRCQVGIVTAMPGPAGLEDFYVTSDEQMPNVIRTQVDVVLNHGAAVLNADDAAVARLATHCDGEVIFYSLDASAAPLAAHRADGGRAIFLRGSKLQLVTGQQETVLMDLTMPALRQLTGALGVTPAELLPAVGAAWALNIAPDLIRAGLKSYGQAPAAH